MKPLHYIKKVKESKPFKELMKEDPKAYLCSLFFLRDFIEKKDETQVDFYSPKKKKIVSFKIDKGIEKVTDKKAETIAHKKFIPKPLVENIKMDVDEMKATLADEMHNREMTYEIEKILAFLNVVDGRAVWNCTGFLRGLGLLQTHVDDESASVLFMEKKSLFDMIKFTGSAFGNSSVQAPPTVPQTQPGNIAVLNPEALKPKTQDKPKAAKTEKVPETRKKEVKSK